MVISLQGTWQGGLLFSELTHGRCWSSQPPLKPWWAPSAHWTQGRASVGSNHGLGDEGCLSINHTSPGSKAWGAHCGKWKGTRNTESHPSTRPPPPNTSIFFSSLICFANWQCQVAQPMPWKSNPQFPITLLVTKTGDNEKKFQQYSCNTICSILTFIQDRK